MSHIEATTTNRIKVGGSDVITVTAGNANLNGNLSFALSSNGIVYQAGPKDLAGSGTPEGAIGAPVGSTYRDSTNGLLYVKTTGTGNTGWRLCVSLDSSGDVTLTGNLVINTVGKRIYIKEGANATMGIATLVSGSAVVSTNKVTANSRIQLTIQSLGTVSVPKANGVTARTPGTSFTITSADATDTSVICWQIFEPA